MKYLIGRYGANMRQACRCVQMNRSMCFFQSNRELFPRRVRFGYRRIYMLMKREGRDAGKDRFYRVYR